LRGHEYEKSDTIKILKVANLQKGDTTILSYTSRYGKLNYFIVANLDSSFITEEPRSVEHRTDSLNYLHLLLDTSILVGGKTLSVKKYILDELVIDGASIHYYEPTVGVYAVHSNTWTSLRYLQSADININKKVLSLIKATVPEFFIRGKLAEELK